MQSNTVKIADIQIRDRARQLDDNWVEVISCSIKEDGLISPIRLWKDAEGVVWLVAGHHRLAAHILLQLDVIEVVWSKAKSWDEARREEVVENLLRNELTALDRAQHLFELKQVYEKLNPEAKQGGDRKSAEVTKNQNAIVAFWSDAADKVGLSARSIQTAVALWKALSVDTKKRVQGTWLADHQACLLNLSKLSAHMQKKIIGILLNPDNGVGNVGDALAIVNKQKLPGVWERKFKGINKALGDLKDDDLFMVLDVHEDRIAAWMKLRGRT